jgi:amino acid transporter
MMERSRCPKSLIYVSGNAGGPSLIECSVLNRQEPGEGAHDSGRRGGLQHSMGRIGALFITVSCLSPSIAVFIVGSDVIRQVGSGVFLCFAAAALFGVAMACVYGELGSALPGSGGEYTILGRVFGPRCGQAVLGMNLLGFSISLALSGYGVATYLGAVWPGLPARPLAALMVVIVTGVAVLHIQVGAVVTGGFLLVELAALATLTVLGAQHVHQPAVALLHPLVARAGGGVAPPALAALGAGTAAGIYAFNGYGAAIFFGEDMHDARRDVAPVVLLALLAGVITVMPAIAFVVLGAPDLRAFTASVTPISGLVAQLGGPGLARLMSAGVALAVFNTMIGIALMAGRQLYATGRDRLWPEPVSSALATTHGRWGSPWPATLVMGGCGLLACLLDPHVLVLILGNSNVITYCGLCFGALHARRTGASSLASWRMPAFPVPALVGILFLGVVTLLDLFDPAGRAGLLVSVITAAAALLLFARSGRSAGSRPGASAG